jgi:proline racemase
MNRMPACGNAARSGTRLPRQIAYGGMTYAITAAGSLGFRLDPSEARDLCRRPHVAGSGARNPLTAGICAKVQVIVSFSVVRPLLTPGCQRNTTVLWPFSRTRRSLCQRTARESASASASWPTVASARGS